MERYPPHLSRSTICRTKHADERAEYVGHRHGCKYQKAGFISRPLAISKTKPSTTPFYRCCSRQQAERPSSFVSECVFCGAISVLNVMAIGSRLPPKPGRKQGYGCRCPIDCHINPKACRCCKKPRVKIYTCRRHKQQGCRRDPRTNKRN